MYVCTSQNAGFREMNLYKKCPLLNEVDFRKLSSLNLFGNPANDSGCCWTHPDLHMTKVNRDF